ncbi:hypothetical protein Mkiyose1088_13920 [Mycobacterium kiyosense]|uniref:M50 family metallopeptidase n=1 Tax=Mycobacterium TaxID=1763 RepID=UPI001EF10FC5|nr:MULTISPECIES: M50 family metallopeptidase [Mycobacterium]BDB41984.1 hypothetical protein IWGMT90018_24300 [Mycobacterium kiyosense]BDE14733.1 hypothetical protein MKCMC460_35930 [Mycobacterium sp. 20KCMC460]GLC03579.1 hypothetical protein SRL2020400_41700 [Mycobacterium kiyosense]GLC99525.1 hypothetical protein Mkiyose1088_13920 [Mycobacterium kiyosense]GLD07267.1 hypothetical protein Mkiyose1383_35930 [Mycobacterium kiyosense]
MPLTLADITAGQRAHLETCIHEAGHAVAGVVLGAELRNAVVVSSKVTGTEGLTTFSDRPHGTDALIAHAGPWAQARWLAGRRPTQREFYAVLDTTGHKDSRVLTASGGMHTGADVVPLLTWCWPAVARTATQLHRTGEVYQADVLAALGITDGGGMTSVQLAAIRSRCREVPPIRAA